MEKADKDNIYNVQAELEMNWLYPTSIFINDELNILGQIIDKTAKNKRKNIHSMFYPQKSQISTHMIEDENSEYLEKNAKVGDKKKDKHGDKQEDEIKEDEEEIDPRLKIPDFWCCKVIYVEHLGEMLLFNGHNGNINVWSCNLRTKKWRIFKDRNGNNLILPKQNDNNFDVTLLHDRIILICYNTSKEIWAYNLSGSYIDCYDKVGKTNDNKWFRKKCSNFITGITENTSMVNVDNQCIHFISFINPSHSMLWVYHLLNKAILKRVYSPMLVSYYIRTYNLRYKFYQNAKKKFPKDIIRIIAEHSYVVFL